MPEVNAKPAQFMHDLPHTFGIHVEEV
jgi:hypothetical protein